MNSTQRNLIMQVQFKGRYYRSMDLKWLCVILKLKSIYRCPKI